MSTAFISESVLREDNDETSAMEEPQSHPPGFFCSPPPRPSQPDTRLRKIAVSSDRNHPIRFRAEVIEFSEQDGRSTEYHGPREYTMEQFMVINFERRTSFNRLVKGVAHDIDTRLNALRKIDELREKSLLFKWILACVGWGEDNAEIDDESMVRDGRLAERPTTQEHTRLGQAGVVTVAKGLRQGYVAKKPRMKIRERDVGQIALQTYHGKKQGNDGAGEEFGGV